MLPTKILRILSVNKYLVLMLFCMLFLFYIYLIMASTTNKNNQMGKSEEKINLRHLLEMSIVAAVSGGYEITNLRSNLTVETKGLTKEGVEDIVTTADFLSHCTMMGILKGTFPNIDLISEEAKTDCFYKPSRLNPELPKNLPDEWVDNQYVTVWIDPLDATHEYMENLFNYVTTMVCVAVNGQPVIGVIYKPFSKQISWAWIGMGHSDDLKQYRIRFRSETKQRPLRIIVSRSHSGNIKENIKKYLNTTEIVIAAGAGYKALEVAYRNVDVYLHVTAIKKWDVCAGNAIINALGGKMSTKYNEVIDYSSTSNPVNERGLIAIMDKYYQFAKNFKVLF